MLSSKILTCVLIVSTANSVCAQPREPEPDPWVAAMRDSHARFSGQSGTLALFGDVSRELNVPLIDYHAEILKRRPQDWDGALEQFRDAPGDEYNVPTLIARDGVHPSNPSDYQDYSERSLSHNGYALRSALTLSRYAEVIRRILRSDD